MAPARAQNIRRTISSDSEFRFSMVLLLLSILSLNLGPSVSSVSEFWSSMVLMLLSSLFACQVLLLLSSLSARPLVFVGLRRLVLLFFL